MNRTLTLATFSMNIHLCFAEMGANRLRTFITSFGIFIGAVSLLVTIALLHGIEQSVTDSMIEIGGLDIITIHSVAPKNDQEKLAFSRSPGLSLEQIESIAHSIPEIDHVVYRYSNDWNLLSANGKERWAKTSAMNQQALRDFHYKVKYGRLISTQDELANEGRVVIGENIAADLFGVPNAVGKKLYYNERSYTVVGILTSLSASAASARGYEAIFPFLYELKNNPTIGRTIQDFSIKITTPANAELVKRKFLKRLKTEHRGVPDTKVETNRSKIIEMENSSKGLKILALTIAAISLIVGAVSIVNIMFSTITLRIREIGIRKALGAHNHDILAQFLIESVFISLAGGIPGMVFGGSIAFVPQGILPYQPILGWADFLLTLMFIVGTGLVSMPFGNYHHDFLTSYSKSPLS